MPASQHGGARGPNPGPSKQSRGAGRVARGVGLKPTLDFASRGRECRKSQMSKMSKISNVENLRFLESCWFLFRLLLKVRSMVGGHLPLVRTRWAERAGVLALICVATCIPAHALHIQRKGMTSGRTLRGGAPSSSPNRGVGPARQESSDFDSSQLQSSSTFAAFERLGSSATMSQLELGAFGVRRVPKTMELLRFMVQPTLLPHCDSMPSSTATCL